MDAYDPPGRITRLPSWLTGQAAAAATRLVGAALAEEGLRRQHFLVLCALADRGAVSQAALGRRLLMDRSDMHAVLGHLEQQGLVTRPRDEHDRRRMLVDLTPAGAATLDRLDSVVEAAQEAYLAPLSATDRAELQRLLTTLVQHHGH